MSESQPDLSIIIPTFNESQSHGLFDKILHQLNIAKQNHHNKIEIIAIDSNSTDDTALKINNHNITIIKTKKTSRAERLNIGITNAKGKYIFLHHPRSLVNHNAFTYIIQQQNNWNENTWGGLKHKFDNEHFFLNYISWYSNNVRLKRKSIVYLDHCIFLNNKLATKAFPLPDMDIFEDTELSIRLKKYAKPIILPNHISLTSAVRFITHGIYKQYFTNQLMKIGYSLGISPIKLNKFYERALPLNTEYEKHKKN